MIELQISDILSSEVLQTDGEARSISLQTGVISSGETHCDNVELWQQGGFASVPPLAQPGSAASQVLCLTRGDRDLGIATRDVLGFSITGALGPGETTIYASGPNGTGQSRVLLKDKDGVSGISLYTTEGNTEDGSPVIIQATSEGKIQLAASTYGFIKLSEEGITLASPGTSSSVDLLTGGTFNITAKGMTINVGATLNVAALTTWITQVNALLVILAGASAVVGSPPAGAIAALPTALPIG